MGEPEHPVPDDKNWTWVLDTPCPECGFDARTIARDDLGSLIRANAAAWRTVLAGGDRVVRRPLAPPERGVVWSALEYGAHVRDVYEVFHRRVALMLAEDDPAFENWDQDATALESDYPSQDPERVAYRLAVNAGQMADVFDKVGGAQWSRTGRRSDGSRFTVESIGIYLLHDPVHHLWDAEQGFEALTA